MTHIVRNLENWAKQQWASGGADSKTSVPADLARVLKAGFSCTIATLLWALPDESPVWRAAVSCAFHLFRLDEQGAPSMRHT